MTIPDYQSIMLPLLQLAGDGREHVIGDAIERLPSTSNSPMKIVANSSPVGSRPALTTARIGRGLTSSRRDCWKAPVEAAFELPLVGAKRCAEFAT
jgi:restriction endonuclease Mrr